jgi:hypothetical protein
MNFDDFDHFQGTVKIVSLDNFLNHVTHMLLTALFSKKLFLDWMILISIFFENFFCEALSE